MKTTTPKLNIALVDDHNLFRKGLIKLINLGDVQQRYHILLEAENGNDLQEKMTQPPFPDIILMDIDMPDTDGFATVEWLQRTHPAIKILVISMVDSESAILRMLRLGIKGFLSKDIEVEDMHSALEAIANNGFYYSQAATEVLSQNLQEPVKNNGHPRLSENEREFIKLATTEMTYEQIAGKMNLSFKTIDGYREALFKRLQVKTRVALAMWAVRNGVVK